MTQILTTDAGFNPRRITQFALQVRLTAEERGAIRAQRATDAQVDDLMGLLEVAQFIDLDHPLTVAGLQLLVAKGLLDAGRVAELSANGTPAEAP